MACRTITYETLSAHFPFALTDNFVGVPLQRVTASSEFARSWRRFLAGTIKYRHQVLYTTIISGLLHDRTHLCRHHAWDGEAGGWVLNEAPVGSTGREDDSSAQLSGLENGADTKSGWPPELASFATAVIFV